MSDGTIYDRLHVLGPRVLARPLMELDSTTGGIVIPDVSRLQQNRAVVEKVGPGDGAPLPFAVGDVVFYQKYAGAWITLAGRDRLMLMAEEIQAVLAAEHAQLLRHDDNEQTEHLEGEPCLICLKQQDSAAKDRLAAMRAELVQEQAPKERLGDCTDQYRDASSSAS